MYQHAFVDGSLSELPLGKVVCVGRNYAAHARELGNAIPEAPILFMKPSTAMVSFAEPVHLPEDQGDCHHETEITLLIGERLQHATEAVARAAIVGIGLGLDLTLRDLQADLKKKGYPWEIAKAFDGAAPLTPFLHPAQLPALESLSFSLDVNGGRRQTGDASCMLTPIVALVHYISKYFTLMPGDVVMTGTPEGVAALRSGDVLCVSLGEWQFQTKVA